MSKIEDIDFIDAYSWLKHRHGHQKLSFLQFSNAIDSYYGLKYGTMPSDEVNEHVVKTMMDIGLLDKNGNMLSLVSIDNIQ